MSKPFHWTATRDRKLGTDSDTKVAAKLGVPTHRVTARRRELGVAPHTPRPAAIRWTPARDRKLGTVADAQLARQWNVSRNAVRRRRESLGKDACEAATTTAHRWTRAQIKKLGQISDAQIARQIGVSTTTVHDKRAALGLPAATASERRGRIGHAWTPREIGLLGTEPDTTLAKKIKLSRRVIQNERNRHNIPAYRAVQQANRWTPAIIARMGKDTDAAIARDLNVHPSAVSQVRVSRGIASRPKARQR